eukprot:COSAG01_NODE_1548_length_9950_cov_29.480865_4_plen_95_part_00
MAARGRARAGQQIDLPPPTAGSCSRRNSSRLPAAGCGCIWARTTAHVVAAVAEASQASHGKDEGQQLRGAWLAPWCLGLAGRRGRPAAGVCRCG